MPRFYFHLNNSHGWTHDREGQELDGVESAFKEAYAGARALISADVLNGLPVKMSSYIAIDNHEGKEIGRVGYGDAVTFE